MAVFETNLFVQMDFSPFTSATVQYDREILDLCSQAFASFHCVEKQRKSTVLPGFIIIYGR